jgi:hypothetical protein
MPRLKPFVGRTGSSAENLQRRGSGCAFENGQSYSCDATKTFLGSWKGGVYGTAHWHDHDRAKQILTRSDAARDTFLIGVPENDQHVRMMGIALYKYRH